jgi:electron transfer flavoprotein-quinone oxidoreductase
MVLSQYDVVVVGAGCAGLTAAVALARAGITVAVVEGAPFPGAENWSGCAYFAENLAEPDVLGPAGVEALAWERRLVERGVFASDGHGLLGATYRDADAFRPCYVVLRPVFDHHLAQVALSHGVALLTSTTVESLVRDGGRVAGVCTQRGPLYADLVFLAEGDAAHLVTREGYERSADPRDAPRFLLGVKQVIELPPGAVEERFALGPEEGGAYEVLLRNPTLHGRPAHLNMRGFVYTNRRSLSVGFALAAHHLRRHFAGDPRLLLEWLEGLPALAPWWRDGRRGTWGAKLIRAGGAADVPHLVDDGLAVGGAASAVGVTFPAPNFTGPATAMGLLLARAAVCIRAEGGDFTRAALERHYLEPLRQTRYWKDVEFLRDWPAYARRTHVFFDRGLDLALGTAHVWARSGRWLPGRAAAWLRLLLRQGGPSGWGDLLTDLRQLGRALRLRQVAGRPALWRLLLDGALNMFRDLARRPRAHLPPAGELRLHYRTADGGEARSPWALRRWYRRFAPVLAAAAREVYRNDARPLAVKLPAVVRLFARQVNLLDLLAAGGLAVLSVLAAVTLGGCGRLLRSLGLRRQPAPPPPDRARDLAAVAAPPADAERPPVCHPAPTSSIHLLGPHTLPGRNTPTEDGLDRVCPAGVFETRRSPLGPPEVAVHFQRCLKCEACWRTSPAVDWGRDGRQRLLYAVGSPAAGRLLEAIGRAASYRPAAPRALGPWANFSGLTGVTVDTRASAGDLLGRLERKLEEFDEALAQGPPVMTRPASDYLEMLARYAHQLGLQLGELLRGAGSPAAALAAALVAKAEERARRTWDGRFARAAADGRQMRQHHLVGLRRLLGLEERPRPEAPSLSPTRPPHEGLVAGAFRVVDELCRRAVEHATRCVQLPGLFRDEQARDAVGKFGAAKRLVAEIAARRALLQTLGEVPGPADREGAALWAELCRALAAEALGVAPGSVSYNAAQLFGATGHLERTVGGLIGAAIRGRFLGEPPGAAYRRYGQRLLAGEAPLPAPLSPTGPGAAAALGAEREEIEKAEEQLAQLARAWAARPQPDGEEADAEVAEGLGRQGAYLLAGKLLLGRARDRLERGLDTAVEVALLRVWLDDAAAGLDEFAGLVWRQLRPAGAGGDRPLIEPGAGPPARTCADYLAAPAPYSSGDFLVGPVDLLQPRLVPEMALNEQVFLGGDARRSPEGEGLSLQGVRQVLGVGRSRRLLAALRRLEALAEDVRAAEARGGPARWRLRRLEEDRFAAAALAFEVVGRSEHPHTRSLRLESALARLFLLGRVRSALKKAGDVLGPSALDGEPSGGGWFAPADEGGDAFLQFFVLRELVGRVAPRWAREGAVPPRHVGREALELEALKAEFRGRIDAARATFGADLWKDTNLQANVFALSDAAAWLKAADSALGRLAWLARAYPADEADQPFPQRDVGLAALARCCAEVRDRLRRFDQDLMQLRRGYYAPHVRAASLLFDRAEGPAPPAVPPSHIGRALSVLVVVEGVPVGGAAEGDNTSWPYWSLGAAGRAALETALRLRDAAPDGLRVQVIALGPLALAPALREALGLGVDRVRLLVSADGDALACALAGEGPFDLVLAGGERARRAAQVLGLPDAGCAALLAVNADGETEVAALHGEDGALVRSQSLPAVVGIEPRLELRELTVAGYLAGLARTVEAMAGPPALACGARENG